ncbi:MAG: metallopeptidase TldD-related protein [Pseudanabaenaceae cyanobacterium bins.39]|nr:metallopeptidase TldD-related protein [Pseudanabaenaceae cyanobacterium bins.39]
MSRFVVNEKMRQNYTESPSMVDPEQLLEYALKTGVDGAEVYTSRVDSHPVGFEANQLRQIESIASEGVGLRLWRDGRVGLAIAYGCVDSQDLVQQALDLCALHEPEEMLLRGQTVANYPQVYGEAIAVETMIERGQQAIAQVRDHYPEAICGADWECSQESFRIINSKGLDCGYTDITVDGSLSAEITRGDDFLNVWYGQSEREDFAVNAIAQRIVQYLDWAKQTTKLRSTTKMPVIFTAKAADLLWGVVAMAMSGRQVQQQTTPWLHKLGETVISPLVDLKQDPNLGIYNAPFDDEGTPTQTVNWIEGGILQGFYGDWLTCQQLAIAPTGNGFRGDLGSPSPGLLNLIVSARQTVTGDIAALAATLKRGLIIDQIMGDEPDLSGDFSVNVELGYRVKDGEIVGRVKDTMVSGNVYQALNQIRAIASERYWHGSLFVPAMIVEGLSISS